MLPENTECRQITSDFTGKVKGSLGDACGALLTLIQALLVSLEKELK